MCEGGGNCAKYLKRGWDGKEGRGNKNSKGGGGKLGQGLGALKKGAGTPLQTMLRQAKKLFSKSTEYSVISIF